MERTSPEPRGANKEAKAARCGLRRFRIPNVAVPKTLLSACGYVSTVSSPKAEVFYWVTIMFSQTLGTALGDWTADSAGFGYSGAAVLFGGLLLVLAIAHYRTRISKTLLFWCAFILTRPLGAVVGDFLDKPVDHGGLALSRYTASLALVLFIAAWMAFFRQRPAAAAH